MKREFDTKTMAIVAVGLSVVMVLTYMAGIVTGIALWTPTRQELAALKGRSSAPPAVQAAAAAPPPTIAAVAAPPHPPAAVPVTAETAKSAETGSSETAPAPAAAPVASATPAAAPAAQPTAPAAQPAAPAAEVDVFSLQLGSFLDAKNAKQLQADLKDRGYNCNIFTALDGEQREWHVVRIGGFRTLSSAAKAASTFTDKERIPAFVRRSDKL